MKTINKRSRVALLSALLLPLANQPAATFGYEIPLIGVKRVWPGQVTVSWAHTGSAPDGDGLWGFRAEREAPFASDILPRDMRIWNVPDAVPNQTTRYRVCAIYNFIDMNMGSATPALRQRINRPHRRR